MTNNLEKRMLDHKYKLDKTSFSAKYNLYKLIFFEEFESINDAILREKQLKSWRRKWKFDLIKEFNPDLKDLSNRF